MQKWFLNKELNAITIFILVLIGSILGIVSSTHALWLIFFVGVLFLIYLLFNWNASLYVLVASTLFSGYLFPVGDAAVRPEHVMIGFTLFSTLFNFILNKKNKLYLSIQSILLVVFVIYAFLGSYFNSPVVKQSYLGIAQLFIAILGFIIISQVYRGKEELVYRLVLFLFIIAAVLETLYGLVAFAIYNIGGINIGGLVTGQSGFSVVTLKGTMVEANTFGSYISSCALIVLALLLSKVHFKYNKLLFVCFILLVCGLLLSWTRAAWIGFIIGLLFLLIIFRKELNIKSIFFTILTLCGVILPLFILISYIFNQSSEQGVFLYKILNLFETESGTGKFRFEEFYVALEHWKTHPILGTGYFSIKIFGETVWISNSIILVLHDTGILGLLLFNIIVLSIILPSIKYSFSVKPEINKNKAYLLALTVGMIQLLFAYNFTPAHTLTFFWVYLGLLYVLTNREKHKAINK